MAPILRLWLVSWVATAPLFSKDLGDQGHLFPVMEEDLLQYIRKKLGAFTTSDLAMLEKKVCQHYFSLAEEPIPVVGIEEANTYRVSFYDPSTIASVDIMDHNGNIVVAKGTTINPLTIFGLTDNLLFIDGSKETHLKWAEAQESGSKWILVKGRPLELEARNQKRVFLTNMDTSQASLALPTYLQRYLKMACGSKSKSSPWEPHKGKVKD